MRAAIPLIALLLATPLPGLAQVTLGQPVEGTGILTLDQNRLYTGSLFGQRMLADIDRQVKALQQENRRLEADLEAEEKLLTERRATLPPEEFRALASAFDEKVTGIRDAREAKARQLSLRQDEAQKTFLQAAIPILAEILREQGAEAIIDRSAIILLSERIDITDLAIERIDAALLRDDPPADAPPDAPATGD